MGITSVHCFDGFCLSTQLVLFEPWGVELGTPRACHARLRGPGGSVGGGGAQGQGDDAHHTVWGGGMCQTVRACGEVPGPRRPPVGAAPTIVKTGARGSRCVFLRLLKACSLQCLAENMLRRSREGLTSARCASARGSCRSCNF